MEHNIIPRFYIDPREDVNASKEAGRPIYRDVELVEVRIAGDKNNIPVFKVTDVHRKRWPEHYAAFKRGEEMSPVGTPVEQWPILSRSKCMELKAAGVMTVEALAELPDSAIHRIGMDARKLIAQAKEFLEGAKDDARFSALAADNETLRAELELLKQQISGADKLVELQKENEELKSKLTKPKRTRRTKEQIDADKAKEEAA
jgi:hypothetical protein